MKRRLFLVLSLIFLFSIAAAVSGCQSASEDAFWVLTEQSKPDGMNLQLELAVEQLRKEYPDVEMNVEILPLEETVRELRLRQIRTQIMAGEGPDVFLLPTGTEVTVDEAFDAEPVSISPLFPDVNQAMRIGLFADLSVQYDSDEELDKSALNQTVMDAGCVGTGRYVFPLRYTMPVLFFYSGNVPGGEPGMDLSHMTAFSIVESTLGTKEEAIGANVDLSAPFCGLPQLLDYDKSTLHIDAAQMEAYLRLYQRWRAQKIPYDVKVSHEGNLQAYGSADPLVQSMIPVDFYHVTYDSFGILWYAVGGDLSWITSGFPLYSGDLGNVIDTVAYSKVRGIDIQMYPFRASDGSISAEVTYYGAANRNTDYPDQAYRLLHILLGEEYQWDLYNRPVADMRSGHRFQGLVEFSWPVRLAGSGEAMWQSIRTQIKGYGLDFPDERKKISRALQNREFTITDEDIPPLNWKIDSVRFPLSDSAYADALQTLNEADGTPADVDIKALAQRLCDMLWWHLTEG